MFWSERHSISSDARVRAILQSSLCISSAYAASDSADGGPNSLCSRLELTVPLAKKIFVESHFCVSYAMVSCAGAV